MEKRDHRAAGKDAYVKKVYFQIICLAFLAHFSYIFIFAALSYHILSLYNIGSVLFYLLMFPVVRHGKYKLAVSAIHIEVCLFVAVCTALGGWELGIHLYLIALSSLVYFCPYDHKFIPYLFSIFEIVLFISLRLYTQLIPPVYTALGAGMGMWLYVYNVTACFVIILYAAFMSNVSAAVTKKELQEENRSLSALANYDQLTGLLTRRIFLRMLEEIDPRQLVIAMGDLDNFKRINDTYGHNCGDYVLSTTALIMRSCFGTNADICRWGGEEYIFLFKNQSLSAALEQLEEFRGKMEQTLFNFEGHAFHMTMTLGVSDNQNGLPPSALIERADQLMYAGKNHGKNRVISEEIYRRINQE